MRVSELPKTVRFSITTLPPMYCWPEHIKRAVLIACSVICFAAYIFLIAGLLGLGGLLLELAVN